MKATVRAELLAIGEIYAAAGDATETLTRGILLVGATDEDVRAFAPLMCTGEVTLEIRRVPPEETSSTEPR